jgi:hypothetical protein
MDVVNAHHAVSSGSLTQESSSMLVRVACIRCRLGSLWTDEPGCFLATVCRNPRACEAKLSDEPF